MALLGFAHQDKEHDQLLASDDGRDALGYEYGSIQVKQLPAAGGHSGFLGAVFNLMNAVLGSGILGLSFAMRESGVVVYLVNLWLLGIMADVTIHFLLRCCTATDSTSYEDVGRHAFGAVGQYAASTAIIMQNTGSMVSYAVIMGDILPPFLAQVLPASTVAAAPYLVNRTYILIAIITVIVFPIALSRRIGWLGYTSFLSVAFSALFAVAVMVKQPHVPCPLEWEPVVAGKCDIDLAHLSGETFFVLPTIAFSFVCHTTLLPVYTELKVQTERNMQNVSHVALLAATVLYSLAGYFGYLSFRGYTPGDLMLMYGNFDKWDPLILTVRLAIVLSVMLTLPLLCFPARKTFFICIAGPKTQSDSWFRWWRHVLFTACHLLATLLMAIYLPDVKVVFGISGATSSVALAFVLPGIFFLKLDPAPLRSWRKIVAIIIVAFGAIVGVACITGIIVSLATTGA